MTQEQQAYVEGFVKRATEYGYSNEEAINILKEAMSVELPMASKKAPVKPKVPESIKGNANDTVNKPQPVKPLAPDEQF